MNILYIARDQLSHRETGMQAAQSTIDATEVAKFEAMAAEWWDPNGKFKPLHMLNPCRLDYITTQIAAEFDRDLTTERPFEGLRLLDIGCGGGLLSEPMARLGADVVGADAPPRSPISPPVTTCSVPAVCTSARPSTATPRALQWPSSVPNTSCGGCPRARMSGRNSSPLTNCSPCLRRPGLIRWTARDSCSTRWHGNGGSPTVT